MHGFSSQQLVAKIPPFMRIVFTTSILLKFPISTIMLICRQFNDLGDI